VCLGKGITGGYLPLSATVAARRVYEGFLGKDLGTATFYHGHSYGGNALACAVALRHLQLLVEWDVLDHVTTVATHLGARLDESVAGLDGVAEVRRRGLMAGVELAPPEGGVRWGRRVCAAAVRRGVLLRPLGDVVVIMPPLTSTEPELDRVVDVLAACIGEVRAEDAG
jgi:adenosylmethionine-8-amino-7-oxononanoate aminotransferase